MAGTFEILQSGGGSFLFRLTAQDGTEVAVSPKFTTIRDVVEGIAAVRENAAMGLVVDHSSGAPRPFREEHAGPGCNVVAAA
ncbi:DUF1508 domain-containing protein [Arthrobacter sp. Y81]|uniref:YegP family protein n=1 Tax=Arthrobacter sp. Y81 TaxID=2058897 RepID=UPI000CE42EDE|nr:DUF1508 domain-containing protein [Arthrobacter sp. Y81]